MFIWHTKCLGKYPIRDSRASPAPTAIDAADDRRISTRAIFKPMYAIRSGYKLGGRLNATMTRIESKKCAIQI